MLNQCRKDIAKYKTKLQGKPVTENFGEKYIRELSNKYHMEGYRDNRIFDLINEFEDWCYEYVG